jgi:hypothetical protein
VPKSKAKLLEEVHDITLSKAMSKVLLWAETLGDDSLVSWIRLELLGYVSANPLMTESTVVPEYRTVTGQWFDEYGRCLVLSDPKLAFINETRLRMGVIELESYLGVTGTLALPGDRQAEVINEHLKVRVSTFRFGPSSVPTMLASIRAQLLDRIATCAALESPIVAKRTPSLTQTDDEIIELRPNFAGIGINLRALWRQWRSASGDKN